VWALLAACGDDDGDAGRLDAGRDGAVLEDATTPDDATTRDATIADATTPDATIPDGGRADAGPLRCEPPALEAADWFVSTTGSAAGSGRVDDPLDLATAFSASGPVRPGDRVELAAGRYVGRFVSRVSGTAEAPIVFAPAPGARVTLDSNVAGEGNGLLLEGAWVEIHGLEITNGGTDRARFVGGVEMHASNAKLVNCVIHDTAQGVSFWSSAVDSELYGNVIYNNGLEGDTRGHGHGIYTQNERGTKRITRNVLFFGYAFGIHAYTEGGSLRGFELAENVWFRTGASRPGASIGGTSDGCLVGGLQPVARTRLVGNHSFGPTVGARSLQLGWGGSVVNEDITLVDNYLVGRVAANGSWESGTLEGNVVHGTLVGVAPGDYPDNEWHTDLPRGTRVVVHANAHDTSRAEVVVYNWSDAAEVSFDVSDVLPVGSDYEVLSVYDLFGSPVASGTYEGGAISVPMGTKPPVQPHGEPSAIEGADDPGRTFGVFVLRSSCRLNAPADAVRTGT
jgi:hypothetical protein